MKCQCDTYGGCTTEASGDFALRYDKFCVMPYVALVNNTEVELPDEAAVSAAIQSGQITPETWIADVNVEADWETVEEKFPELCASSPPSE